MSFTFRNKAYDKIKSEGWTHVNITTVRPNSEQIYFEFTNGEGRKLTKLGKKALNARFKFQNKTEYEVVKGFWQKEYDLLYDLECSLFYIDAVSPKQNQR